MAGVVRAKAGDFDVITEQIGILRNFVHSAAEELLLIIEAWTPGEIRADLQVFAHAMADHVLGVDAFGRLDVMGATSGMDVMIARPPARFRWINPADELEGVRLARGGN